MSLSSTTMSKPGPDLPVIEIGHLFPNYRPHAAAQRNEEAVACNSSNTNQAVDKENCKNDSGIRNAAASATQKTASDPWDRLFEELKAFQRENGRYNVPILYSSNKRLGRWVANQILARRVLEKAKNRGEPVPCGFSFLTEERIARLDTLGFDWKDSSNRTKKRNSVSSWSQRFEELIAFKRRHGHLRVPTKKGGPHKKLSTWIGTQRATYREIMKERETGKRKISGRHLTDERIDQMKELGFRFVLEQHTGRRTTARPINQQENVAPRVTKRLIA